jgi:hypothetical protein
MEPKSIWDLQAPRAGYRQVSGDFGFLPRYFPSSGPDSVGDLGVKSHRLNAGSEGKDFLNIYCSFTIGMFSRLWCGRYCLAVNAFKG